ncbi:MAG: haloacid dehalogenase-like hydrolase [Chloroflexota bacterium]|nr:haloacid dehalogenase-like hydrolase [Chloroflexota bacterium]
MIQQPTHGETFDKLVLWDLDHTLLNPAGFGKKSTESAFRQLFSTEAPDGIPFAGRTDRAILSDFITRGARGREKDQDELQTLAAELAEERRETFAANGGQALPGALEVLTQLGTETAVIQSVLSGNLRRIGQIKVDSIGASALLDLDVAAFGDHHTVRGDLVQVAATAAKNKYGHTFAGHDIILIGDTPLDIEAALSAGATPIGVANGGYTVADLVAAGASIVLSDLRAPEALLAGVLGT